jgi:SAM-dependent methyltransferase
VTDFNPQNFSVGLAAREWWREAAGRDGRIRATGQLISALWGFARNSTPGRLRQLFGDAEYDWDHRVNTTSGAVAWRERLLGVFHSPYQPTEPALFHEMLDGLRELNFGDFTFLDLGSGKGRTLLMASDYPFHRIVGVELLPALHQIAQQNLKQYQSESQKCFALEAICADAAGFAFPDQPLLIYLFNPFPEPVLRKVIANLAESLRACPRAVYVLYHNPLLENVVAEAAGLNKVGGTHQYSIFRFGEEAERGGVD